MLDNLFHDEAETPLVRERFSAFHHYMTAARETLMTGRTPHRARRRRTQAGLGHAIAFATWKSLVQEQGLDDIEAAVLLRRLVDDATGRQDTPRLRKDS